jgi:hypothetical protein
MNMILHGIEAPNIVHTVADLGEDIGTTFAGLQKYLYAEQVA